MPSPTRSSLSSADAFLLDNTGDTAHPSVYVWIGSQASLKERRLAMQYAHNHLHAKREKGETAKMTASIIKMNEGSESDDFLHIIDAL